MRYIVYMKSDTLYHQTKTGAIQTWQVRTEGDEVISTYGQLDGKMQESRFTAEATNVGKSNERNPEEQAVFEAEALVKKQLRKKYFPTIEEATATRIQPMKAHDYFKKFDKYVKPVLDNGFVYAQPKLDGLRCMAFWRDGEIVLLSRGNKEYNVPHLKEQIAKGLPKEAVLDGELYIHGVSFQTVSSYCRKVQPGTENVMLRVYDYLVDGEDDSTWFVRRDNLRSWDKHYNRSTHVTGVWDVPLSSEVEIAEYNSQCLAQGYEGIMIRLPEGKYLHGYRSDSLLKYKSFIDDEFEIVGFETGKGKFEGVPMITCKTSEGLTFNVTPTGTMEERAKLLEELPELIGHMYKVKYFELTDDNLPRFPVGLGVRIEEDLPL